MADAKLYSKLYGSPTILPDPNLAYATLHALVRGDADAGALSASRCRSETHHLVYLPSSITCAPTRSRSLTPHACFESLPAWRNLPMVWLLSFWEMIPPRLDPGGLMAAFGPCLFFFLLPPLFFPQVTVPFLNNQAKGLQTRRHVEFSRSIREMTHRCARGTLQNNLILQNCRTVALFAMPLSAITERMCV